MSNPETIIVILAFTSSDIPAQDLFHSCVGRFVHEGVPDSDVVTEVRLQINSNHQMISSSQKNTELNQMRGRAALNRGTRAEHTLVPRLATAAFHIVSKFAATVGAMVAFTVVFGSTAGSSNLRASRGALAS